jgi:biopolymer transport protein ExbD
VNTRRWTIALTVIAALDLASLQPALAKLVTLTVEADGAYVLEGHRYTSPNLLDAQLHKIARRKPPDVIEVVIPNGKSIKDLAPVIKLLQDAGVPSVGFLIEPPAP